MKKENKHIIVYTFQSLEDPLVKGLMLQYLLALKSEKVFHLITHEQPGFKLGDEEVLLKKEELRSRNILWYPVDYHNGRFLLLKKLFDFIKTFFICLKIKWKFKADTILGFLPIAGGFGSIISSVLNLKLIVYCFEPHSEYMADFGIWPRKSFKYVLLKKFEYEQLEIARDIIVPTSYTRDMVEKINPYARIIVLPISIDTDKNRFNPDKRLALRKEWGIENKKVFFYMGKFGGIYYDIPTVLDFMQRFVAIESYHILIISPDKEQVDEYIRSRSWDTTFFTVLGSVPYDVLSDYISVADLGLVAVPPLPSQKYRTPVKTGLYLSCGIPYVINKGIAEDDIIAVKNNVGIVVDDILKVDFRDLAQKIDTLLSDAMLRERCRKVAVENRSHDKAVHVLNHILNDYL